MYQPKACVVCHGQFTPRTFKQVTCCNRCYMYQRRHPNQADAPKSCNNCGEPIPPGCHRARKWCSARCGGAASKRRRFKASSRYHRYAHCNHCGAELNGRAGRRFCGERCERRERAYPGSAAFFANRRCEHCGETIPAEARYNKRHCSNRCTVLANQLMRRSRKAALPAERLSRRDVFERDGWICHLCRQPVDQTLFRPHPYSASLDHIIPMNQSGCPGHIWSNVALAHLFCNISKNARTRPEDWAHHVALDAGLAPAEGLLF